MVTPTYASRHNASEVKAPNGAKPNRVAREARKLNGLRMAPEDLTDRIRIVLDSYSNAQAARLLGVSDETVRRVRDGALPSSWFVVSLCSRMGISADWLLLGLEPREIAARPAHHLGTASARELCRALAEKWPGSSVVQACEMEALPMDGLARKSGGRKRAAR